MNQTAIIGIGEMGAMIANRILQHGIVTQEELCLFDRNMYKMEAVQRKYPGVRLANSPAEAARGTKYIFICVQPPNIPNVIVKIRETADADANLFCSSSNVSLEHLKKLWNGKASKFLPTINSAIDRGVIYAAHNAMVKAEEKLFFETCLRKMCGRYYEIREEDFALLNNLAGCAPAFLAYFCGSMCKAAYEMQRTFPYEEIERMFLETLDATGSLIFREDKRFDDVLSSVGKPGGITHTALSALAEKLPEAASELMRRSVARHDDMDKIVDEAIDALCNG